MVWDGIFFSMVDRLYTEFIENLKLYNGYFIDRRCIFNEK